MTARRRSVTRRQPKPKLLFDESLPPRSRFTLLNQYCNTKHIVGDFKLSGVDDPTVYQKALATDRILVTFNIKDFRPMLKSNPNGPSIVGVSTNLTNIQISTKLLSLVKKMTVSEFKGKYWSLTK